MDGCGITGDFSRADQLEVIKYYVAIVEHYVSQIKKPEEESKWKLRKVRPGKWIQGTEDYKKQFYDLLLPDGEIVFYCYPNA